MTAIEAKPEAKPKAPRTRKSATLDLVEAEQAEAKRAKDAERKRKARGGKSGKPREHTRYLDGTPAMTVARGIGIYLEEIAGGAADLDEEAVAAAKVKLEAQFASASSRIAALKLRQKIRDLTASARPHEHKAHFVKYAAEFAQKNGIDYATFREMGVPANVLKDAGVFR